MSVLDHDSKKVLPLPWWLLIGAVGALAIIPAFGVVYLATKTLIDLAVWCAGVTTDAGRFMVGFGVAAVLVGMGFGLMAWCETKYFDPGK